jgi:hypothetical protein
MPFLLLTEDFLWTNVLSFLFSYYLSYFSDSSDLVVGSIGSISQSSAFYLVVIISVILLKTRDISFTLSAWSFM